MSDLRYCYHCNQNLPRRTVYDHLLNHRKRPAPFPRNDDRRGLRCRDSSDEDELPQENADIPENGTNDGSSDTDDGTQSEDQDDYGTTDEMQHWDNENEDDLDRDVCNPSEKQQQENNIVIKFVHWVLSCVILLQCTYILSDRCLEHILLLLSQLFTLLGKFSTMCRAISGIFPVTLYMMRKLTDFDRDDFSKFIVCPNCTALYKYSDIVKESEGRTTVLKCTNTLFGCHVDKHNLNFRKRGKHKCGATLVREIQLKNGRKYYPLKIYSFKSIINSLESLLSRPGFKEACLKWKNRNDAPDLLGDVYDGSVWKEFLQYQHKPFLSEENNYAVMINVDWFQPFKRRPDYSVGVLYMVILNLPRTVRFKMENVILVGVIPNLSREPSDLNSFLEPLVQELKLLQKGLTLSIKGNPEKVGAVLLCASSDIPAARKLSGFMGHAALQGCSLCCINFLDKDGNRYCGPVDQKWKSRSREDHLRCANQAKNAKTLTKQKEIQKRTGFKYTKLLDLEYFHPSRFSVVEPMHNLFLGTAKKMFVTWIDKDILSKEDLELISERIKKLHTSSDIGRIPTNIASNYGTFTAEEWKNWVLVYSLYCLSGILHSDHLRAWQRFVLACRHLCQPTIPKTRLGIAHRLFLQFVRDVEELYGPNFLTPNMHLHGHLVECIENYGSMYGFWAFSFERYNGFLADFPTNNRSVEVQLMRKFLQIGFAADVKFKDLGDEFNEVLKTFSMLDSTEEAYFMSVEMFSALNMPVCEISHQIWSDLSPLSLQKSSYQLSLLGGNERMKLVEVYTQMYGRRIDQGNVSALAKVYHTVEWNKEMFGSSASARGINYKVIQAKWASDDGSVNPGHSDTRPGCVKHFVLHTLELDEKHLDHLFAVVEWYKSTDDTLGYLPPVAVFSVKHINDGAASFLPIQKMQGKCAWTIEKRGHQTFIVVSSNCPRLFI